MKPGLVQTVWADVIVRALGDAGVIAVVVSPGSRSTPLAAALAAQRGLAVHVIVDERAAGFFALGLARASGAPVALVCTSGTAPAHYYPAVIEAAMADVPLVVLSADRPPELHGGGAPQTIDQLRLFGGHVRAFVDLGPPEGTALALRALRRRVGQAVLASRGPRPGPVHLDVPLRKPLEPVVATTAEEAALVASAAAARSAFPAPPQAPRADDAAITALAAAIGVARRPLIVVGPRGTSPPRDRALAAAVSRLARDHGAAVLAETTSGLRGALDPGVTRLDAFDLVLGTPALAATLIPDLIVQLGAEPVALAWPAWIFAHADVPRWVIAEQPWPDADSSATGLVLGDVVDTLERASALAAPGSDPAWLRAVGHADRAAWAIVGDLLGAPGELMAEGAAVRAALDRAGDAIVMLGNSLPVRVVDQVWRGTRPVRVISQRGACGIDGLIAGAAGAAATGTAVVLILGDVSFAHDVGALSLLRATVAPVTVVVIDNGGGRIFEALPVAGTLPGDAFERLWLTPPGLDVVAVARAFGLSAATVTSPAALGASDVTIVHAPVAPSSARELRRAAIAALTESVHPQGATP